MSRFRLSLVAAATMSALMLAACGKEAPKPAPAAPPPPPSVEIKIGHVGPLTGGIAHLGKDNENGAVLAIEEPNAAKIKIDGKDAKFTLV